MARVVGGYVLGDGSDLYCPTHPGQANRIAETGPRLHHYMLKSREEWLAKKARGALSDGAAPGFKRFTDDYAARDANCNLVPDDTLPRMARRHAAPFVLMTAGDAEQYGGNY
jgi:hypothetical protein